MSLRAGYKGLKPEQIRKIEETTEFVETNKNQIELGIEFLTASTITALQGLIDGAPYEPASGSVAATKKTTTKKKTGGD